MSFDETNNYDGKAGPGQQVAVSGDWIPPVCWWEPKYTPQQMAGWVNGSFKPGDYLYAVYHDGKPYTDFNIGKNGMWWDEFQLWSPNTYWQVVYACGTGLMNGEGINPPIPMVWADAGQVPPGGGTLTGKVLGQLALQHLRVPPINRDNVGLAPNADNQVVNLASWLWLKQDIFHPLSVKASLKPPMPQLSATATATPVSLAIDPGDSNAQVFTSGCMADAEGHIGQQWAGQSGQPTCGVLYGTPGRHTLTLKVVWNVTWTSNDPGYPGGTVPGPTTSQGQVLVTDKEIETTN